MRLKGYDAWKTRADLDDWAAQNHDVNIDTQKEPPAGCCSICLTPFGESGEGVSGSLCDACVDKHVEAGKEA